MNKLRLTGIFAVLISFTIMLLFNRCMHDEYDFSKLDDEIEITAGLLTPIAYGSLTFEDIISEFDSSSFITSDADGLLMLTYEDSLISFLADDVLEIPSQDFIEFFIQSDFTIPPGFGTGDTIKLTRTKKFPFSFSQGEQLDSMILDEGDMIFDITSQFQHEGKIVITCPNIRQNNVPFEQTIVINDASGSFTYNTPFNLDGHTIYLNDSAGTDEKYIPVDFYVELVNSGAGISPTDSINVTATLDNMDFDAIFGYIGNYELLTEPGEVDLGFFENTLDGYIRFEEPEIKFHITNSFGVPAAVDIERFTGFKSSADSIVMEFHPDFNPFGYAFPTLEDYSSGEIYKEKTITINKDSSNIADFLAFLPSRLEYNISAQSNPDLPGFEKDSSNFISDDSRIDVDFEFVLPLYFAADSFALEDTIDLDLTDIEEDADFIEQVNIALEVFNGLPLDIDFQLYFLDENYNPVDTLFSDDDRPVISAGQVDPASGEVVAPGVKPPVNVIYTNDDISKLNTVKYGRIRAGLKTPSDANNDLIAVKFLTDYKIEFNLSMGVDVRANSNDF